MFLAKVVLAVTGTGIALMLTLSASACGTAEHMFALLAGIFLLFLVFDIVEN